LIIIDIFGYYLRVTKKMDEDSIDVEISRVGAYISSKITELNRKSITKPLCVTVNDRGI